MIFHIDHSVRDDNVPIENNYSIYIIIGDGNCLFRSVAYCLYKRNDRFYYIVRQKIVQHVVTKWDLFERFVVGGTYPIYITSAEEYKEYMKKSGVYGGFIEIAAISQVYNINIRVFIGRSRDVYTFIPDENNRNAFVHVHVSLLYTGDGDNGHYDVLNMVSSENVESNVLEKSDAEVPAKRSKNNKSNTSNTKNKKLNTKPIGEMNVVCQYCGALYWLGETNAKSCCHGGKVKLPDLSTYPTDMEKLFSYSDFRTRIRNYNSMFAFASFSTKIVPPQSAGVYTMKIQGQVHHVAPTNLCGTSDAYGGQIYIYEPVHELEARMKFGGEETNVEYVQTISKTMNEMNPYVKSYKQLYKVHKENTADEYNLYFIRDPRFDLRRYNTPVTAECAAIIISKDGNIPDFDLCTYPLIGNGSKVMNKLSCHVDPMVFPILFPTGDIGWSPLMVQKEGESEKRISVLQYYSYRLAYRCSSKFNPIIYGGRLHQQYIIHAFIMIESTRLSYVYNNQKKLRIECYEGLWDHVSRSALNNPSIFLDRMRLGNVFVLPSTYVGSPRYMQQAFQDSMAIVRKYGRPDLFITMTCNPKWCELQTEIEKLSTDTIKLKSEDVPLLVVRLFHLKLKAFLGDILSGKVFGPILAWMYSIEFQKRGLPHVHCLFTLHHDKKLRTPNEIDSCIRAEIPILGEDNELRDLVVKHMLHGPHSSLSPCLNEKNVCTKKFPKPFVETTIVNENGFPSYRRRDNRTSENVNYNKRVNGCVVRADNSMVVPYNPYLLKQYNCHINVEYCRSVLSTKYIHKYILKGHDRATIALRKKEGEIDEEIYNEVSAYLDSRYVSPMEAAWRILELPLINRSHTVIRLPVHLENKQSIVYSEGNERGAIENPLAQKTALTAWFDLNEHDLSARKILYRNIPEFYTFNESKVWTRRKIVKQVIGRITSVSPKDVERFHLKLILNRKVGAISFKDLLTHEDILYPTYKEAALAMGLIENDKLIFEVFDEACEVMMPKQLRLYFALFLCHESPSNPRELWERYKKYFIEDVSENKALQEISSVLINENFSCSHFQLPEPCDVIEDYSIGSESEGREEREESLKMKQRLNIDQLNVFDTIIQSFTTDKKDKLFFVDGSAGTGKTFVYKTLIYYLLGEGFTVLPVAWTGIAAILLPGGTTSHRAFGLPIDMNIKDACLLTKKQKELLFKCDVIIWDEASMIYFKAINMVDTMLQDLCSSDEPFGGKFVIFGGDFRQILPVIKFGGRREIVQSTIKCTSMWPKCKILTLKENVRTSDVHHAKWLLNIGNGTVSSLEIPEIWYSSNIIDDIYGETISPCDNVSSKVILACHNDDVRVLNQKVLQKIKQESHTYYSIDYATSKGCDQADDDIQLNYQIEYLNSLTLNNFPTSNLTLKVGAIVMLLRNLSIKVGLCNGTRLQITRLCKNSICGRILTGVRKGEEIFIPRIKLNTDESSSLPFVLHRTQFPVCVAFAMTINKSQGQSFDHVGLYVHKPLFSHGQLYVALSRCTTKEGIKIQITNKNNKVENIVWPEIFD